MILKKRLFQFIFTFIIYSMSFVIMAPVESHLLSKKNYFTDIDGVIRMNINIIGHVKNPGNHIVYDGISILSAISLAGGYLEGADLKNIIIYHADGSNDLFNLKAQLSKQENNISIILKPHDTICIKQKKISQIFVSSNLPSLFLSILNIALTLNRD